MRRWSLQGWLALFIALLGGCSCEKTHSEMTAEEALAAYLDLTFNMQDLAQKEDLMELTTGSVKAALASATEETLKAAYIDRRYLLEAYDVSARNDKTPRETEISYTLQYRELAEGQKDFREAAEITTRNTVAMLKEDGRWRIADVLGKDSSVDFPVSPLGDITPGDN